MTEIPIEPELFWILTGAGAVLFAILVVFVALPEDNRPVDPLVHGQKKMGLLFRVPFLTDAISEGLPA